MSTTKKKEACIIELITNISSFLAKKKENIE